MNRNFQSKSIILAHRPFGEKNSIVRLFTTQFGLVDAVAYGTRSMNSKLRVVNSLGVIGTAYLYMKPGNSLNTLRDFDAQSAQPQRNTDAFRFLYISLWAEVMIATFGSGSEYQQSFALLSAALTALQQCTKEAHYRLATARFFWRYLHINGNAPNISHCAACATPLENQQVIVHTQAHFYCQRCARTEGAGDGERYPARLIDYFVRHAGTSFQELMKREEVLAQADELFRLAALCMQEIIGHELKSLRVILALNRSPSPRR